MAKFKRLNVNVPSDKHKTFRLKCVENETTFSEVINLCIDLFISGRINIK